MSRRVVGCRCLFLVAALGGLAGRVSTRRADEDPRTIVAFLQELKAHGLHDVALDYIDQLRADASLPADLKVGLDYEEGRTPDRRGEPGERPGPPRGAAPGRQGQARGVRQGPSRAAGGPRRPGADGQAPGRARLPGDAPGRGDPGQGEEGRQARRGPRPPTCRPTRPTPRPSWRSATAKDKYPISMPENDPRRAERDAVDRLLPRRDAPARASATTSWPRPIRRAPPSGRSTWTRPSSNSRASTRRTASNGPG